VVEYAGMICANSCVNINEGRSTDMGFFDGLAKGLGYSTIDAYNDEKSSNYQETGLENTSSNNGWYKCIKCGNSFRKGDMDIDHILPKSLGGTNERHNLQCICKSCNRSKQADTSETLQDLARRKKELNEQNKSDRNYLKQVSKYND